VAAGLAVGEVVGEPEGVAVALGLAVGVTNGSGVEIVNGVDKGTLAAGVGVAF
jgi:hypothetical protein